MTNTQRTWLQSIAQQQKNIAEMEKYQRTAVAQARLSGHTWAEIGQALGMSRQAAHERFKEAEPLQAPVKKP